jgi:hypothetical protein
MIFIHDFPKHFIPVFLIGCAVLGVRCNPLADRFLTKDIPAPTAEIVITATPEKIVEASPTIKVISTPTEPTASSPEHKCLEILPNIPVHNSLSGTIVFTAIGDDRKYLLSLPDGEEKDLQSEWYSLSTSPKGTWWAYREGSWLMFVNKNGQTTRKFAIQPTWFFSPIWFDDHWFVTNLQRGSGIVPNIEVINPESGEQQILSSNYPGLIPYAGAGGDPFHIIFNSLVYDPTLNYVVYPKTEDEQRSIVLWDRKQQKMIAQIEDEGYFYHNPVWAWDGKSVFVAVEEPFTDVLYRMDLDGQVFPLTNAEKTGSMRIGVINLSPDGKQVAFWKKSSNSWRNEDLVLLDLDSFVAEEYCLSSIHETEDLILWSPDSRFLLIGDHQGNNEVRTIIFDVHDEWAAEVPDVLPSGWIDKQK